MEPQVWHTLVIRLWRDGDGLKIRFLAGRTGQRLSTLTLETSVASAIRRFEQWLRSADPDGPLSGEPPPAPRRTTPFVRPHTRTDDGETTGGETTRS